MQEKLGWDDMRLVLAIGASGTLTGAAKALGIDHSTAFRRLSALETRLGVRLFERARNGYTPTSAGEAIAETAARMDAELASLERRLAGQDLRPSGTVRLTTTDTLLDILSPAMAAFRAAYPDIVLELIVTNSFLTLSKRDADVAIRPASQAPDTLVGRRVARIETGFYAAKGYLELDSMSFDPATQLWIGPDESLSHTGFWRWLHSNVPEDRIVLRSDSLLGLRAAARAGLGLTALPCFLGDAVPDLVRVGDPMPELGTDLWLLTHPDLRRVARIRAFLDFMADRLDDLRATFAGTA